ncbi:MAG: DUF481 domain-containing protein [Candidatus Korobacteraceae bacterium]
MPRLSSERRGSSSENLVSLRQALRLNLAMKQSAAVFFCMLLLSAPLAAGDKTDVVFMKNGDRLTCEIKGLDSGVLYVSVDYLLGTQSLEWSKVEHLQSKHLFIVKTQDGSTYAGTLSTVETERARPVKLKVIETEGQTVVLDPMQVVQAEQSSEKFLQRFNGSINSGIIYSKGNQTTQYNLSSDIEYPRERWSAGIRLLRWDNWFYSGQGDFLQSSEQGIKLQSTLGGGIGLYLKNTNQLQISLLGGLAWQGTKYEQSSSSLPEQNVAAALIAAKLKLYRFDKTHLDVAALVLPVLSEPGRLKFATNVGYYVKFLGDFTWNLSFYANWDNRPPPGFAGSDYGTSSGLGWTFGNR